MIRVGLFASILFASPAATAWMPCEQAGITAPVAMHRAAPNYPRAVREIGIEGSVEVSLTVLRDGSVGWVRIDRAEPRGYFEQAAAESVRGWRFTPARQNGVPIECRMKTRVRFTLVDTVAASAGTGSGAEPEPVYPPSLLQQRIEGYAEVEFDRAPDGSVKNARVIRAMPRGEFERAALKAVQGWRSKAPEARHETRRFESSVCPTARSANCRPRHSGAHRFRWPRARDASPGASRSNWKPMPQARWRPRGS